ncbi:MAG: hypothetical protein HW412_2376, partial [Bacteroidetes bacterium]|nr:hypothetical protein [Bacteroidota bacterium]
GKGLARSLNGGRSWESFRYIPEFVSRGIFAVDILGDTIWASTGFTKDVDGQGVQTGTGFAYSTDNGNIWIHRPQPLDDRGDSLETYGSNTVKFLPIVVPEQNVTFDVALSSGTVWIASWSSGLRKSINLNSTNPDSIWQRIVLPSRDRNTISPSDALGNYSIDPRRDNNFLAFSVFAQTDSIIWCGTAGGINKSTDSGLSWSKYTTFNQQAHILGNWVIAIKGQALDSSYRLWCTNWKADIDPNEQYGVSYTEDGGRIWKNFLHGIKAYDFAFKDSIAYIATDEGVYRTNDGGTSWNRSGTIIDKTSGQRITSTSFFSVGVIDDTVYCGSGDGLVKTIDNATHPFGETWEVLRAYRPIGTTATTYAYPNPFSPAQEVARFHYSSGGAPASVTIEVFDFGMNRVRTVVKDAQRSGQQEHDEIWDGQDDARNKVTNGVYFYRVVLNSGDPVWGKVMVLE